LFNEAAITALVRIIGFSNPTVTTRKGNPSDRRTIFKGTPSLVVTIRPNKNANEPERRTEAASQKLEPSRLIDRNRDTKVKCMERYPRTIITISRDSAFWTSSKFMHEPLLESTYLQQIDEF
jgi:hypothetical protein